jgi:rhodanese-related sulfurtransferase
MAEVERISVADARRKVQMKTALLVCAYPDEAKFKAAHLEGAIPLANFEARAAALPKAQEIVFYCA